MSSRDKTREVYQHISGVQNEVIAWGQRVGPTINRHPEFKARFDAFGNACMKAMDAVRQPETLQTALEAVRITADSLMELSTESQ